MDFFSGDQPLASVNTQSVLGTTSGPGTITSVANEVNGHAAYKMENKSIIFTHTEITSFILIMKYLPANVMRILIGDNINTSYAFHDDLNGTNIFDTTYSDPTLRANIRMNMVKINGGATGKHSTQYKMLSFNSSMKMGAFSFGNDRNITGRHGNYFLAYVKLWTSLLTDSQFQKEEEDAMVYFGLVSDNIFKGLNMKGSYY